MTNSTIATRAVATTLACNAERLGVLVLCQTTIKGWSGLGIMPKSAASQSRLLGQDAQATLAIKFDRS